MLLGGFPLFLQFLSSLVTFALWNSGEAWETKAFLQTKEGERTGLGWTGCSWKGPAGSSSVTISSWYSQLGYWVYETKYNKEK